MNRPDGAGITDAVAFTDDDRGQTPTDHGNVAGLQEAAEAIDDGHRQDLWAGKRAGIANARGRDVATRLTSRRFASIQV
jgi:hypothetical protein